jgi:cytochrome c oxidase cbb3-type subunit 1
MSTSTTPAASAEVSTVDRQARQPVVLLAGAAIVWLVASGALALIAAVQLHSPGFMTDCEWFTHGRIQAMRESAFIYGWAANAGLATSLWILSRLGGTALRGAGWTVVGTLFWNLGLLVGLGGIAGGHMTSFALLQLPSYVQPLMLAAYGAIAVAGILAWSGRRTDATYASHWYAVAALFLFPWFTGAAQAVLLWEPLRGSLQAVAGVWHVQNVWSLWLAPFALAAAYYVVPKVSGRALPSYDFAPLAFWTLVVVGSWIGGRNLIGGPVPAWIPSVALVASSLALFHYLVVALNLRVVFAGSGNAMSFMKFGFVAYLAVGILDALLSFRGLAENTQFTLIATAVEQLGQQGAYSMIICGAIYYLVPRVTGLPWQSGAMVTGHRIAMMLGVVLLIVALFAAGNVQGAALADAKVGFGEIAAQLKFWLLVRTAAEFILLAGNLLLLVNFALSTCCCRKASAGDVSPFRHPSALEAPAR